MRRSVYAQRKSAHDSEPAIAQRMRKFGRIIHALHGGVAAADDGKCGMVQKIEPPFHIQERRRIDRLQEELRIIAVAERDDVVRAVGEPCKRVLRAFSIAAAEDRTCNGVRYNATYFS